jgi:hypothetical protein
MDLNAALATVTTALDAALAGVPGIGTASTDPSQVTAPGAWVSLLQLDVTTMGSWDVATQVALVVTDSDGGPGPAAALSTLLAACLAAGIRPDGPVVARSLLLPSNPAPLPGLVFPITVRIAE